MKFLYIYGKKFTKYLHGIFPYYPNDFLHKRKIYNFDPHNVFLAIATNIPQRVKTGFVVQGHILERQGHIPSDLETFLIFF